MPPPSRVAGRTYRLLLARDDQPGVLDWAAVTRLLSPAPVRSARDWPSASRDASSLAAWVERLEEGNRNSGLFWAACRAIEDGHTGTLGDLAEAAASTGLSDHEIARTISSARRSAQRGERKAVASG